MWLEILFVAGLIVWLVFALRNLQQKRRRGCARDCTKCGACRSGVWAVDRGGEKRGGGPLLFCCLCIASGAGSQAANRAPRFSTVLLDISTVLFMLHKISAGKGGFRGGDLLNVRKIVQVL